MVYSIYYMFFDFVVIRFIFYIFGFVFFMNWFLVSLNMFGTIIGWECLGLFSFFLISYWFYRYNTLKCGFRAMFIGKLGDMIFMLAFGLVLMDLISTSYFCMLFIVDFLDFLNFFVILIFFVAFSKSTQFGLHV
eukprot:PhF_6_TR26061/c0_g1_i1/m.36732